jgi:hypothetical protein
MIVVTTPLGAVGLMAIVYLTFLFANLSRRLCTVTKRANYSHWFLVAGSLVALAAGSQVVRGIARLAPDHALPILLDPWFSLLTFHVPLSIGVTLCLVLVWTYWGWILQERID